MRVGYIGGGMTSKTATARYWTDADTYKVSKAQRQEISQRVRTDAMLANSAAHQLATRSL